MQPHLEDLIESSSESVSLESLTLEGTTDDRFIPDVLGEFGNTLLMNPTNSTIVS